MGLASGGWGGGIQRLDRTCGGILSGMGFRAKALSYEARVIRTFQLQTRIAVMMLYVLTMRMIGWFMLFCMSYSFSFERRSFSSSSMTSVWGLPLMFQKPDILHHR